MATSADGDVRSPSPGAAVRGSNTDVGVVVDFEYYSVEELRGTAVRRLKEMARSLGVREPAQGWLEKGDVIASMLQPTRKSPSPKPSVQRREGEEYEPSPRKPPEVAAPPGMDPLVKFKGVMRELQFDRVPGVHVFPLHSTLLHILESQARWFTVASRWTESYAFKRDVVIEGRVVKHGSKPGYEVTDDFVPFSAATLAILRVVGYLPCGGLEPDRAKRICVTWNRYDPAADHGTPPHKNWAGLEQVCCLRFGEGSVVVTFEHHGEETVAQSRRLRSCMMLIEGQARTDFLHSVTGISGGVHYSMVIRVVADDLGEVQSRKRSLDPRSASRARSLVRETVHLGRWDAAPVTGDRKRLRSESPTLPCVDSD